MSNLQKEKYFMAFFTKRFYSLGISETERIFLMEKKKKPSEIRFEKEAKALQKNLEKRRKQQQEREKLKNKEKETDGQD